MIEECACGACERARALLVQYEERREEARSRTDQRRDVGDFEGEQRSLRQPPSAKAAGLRLSLNGPTP